MEITLPAPLENHLSAERAAVHLAVGLYTAGEASLVRAAHVAGMTAADFMQELGRRRIVRHYDVEDLELDLKNLRELFPE